MTSLPIEHHPIPPSLLQVHSYHYSLSYYAYNNRPPQWPLPMPTFCQFSCGLILHTFRVPIKYWPLWLGSGSVGKVFITAQSRQPKLHHSEALGKQDVLVWAWDTGSELQVDEKSGSKR